MATALVENKSNGVLRRIVLRFGDVIDDILSLVTININALLMAPRFEAKMVQPPGGSFQGNGSRKEWRKMGRRKEVVIGIFTKCCCCHVWLTLLKSMLSFHTCLVEIQADHPLFLKNSLRWRLTVFSLKPTIDPAS